MRLKSDAGYTNIIVVVQEKLQQIFAKHLQDNLHTDGYAGYSALFEQGKVKGVGCWAHARCNFFKITKSTKRKGLAHEAVAQISQLYGIEKTG